MKWYILLVGTLWTLLVYGQATSSHIEIPYMNRASNFHYWTDQVGDSYYFFTSRSCGSTDWLQCNGNQCTSKVKEFNFLVEAILPKEPNSLWVLAKRLGWHLMEMDKSGEILFDWQLPISTAPIYGDPVLKDAEGLTLLLDGTLYKLDPYRFTVFQLGSDSAFKNFEFDHKSQQIFAYGDSSYFRLDTELQLKREHNLFGIRDLMVDPVGNVLLLTNRDLFLLREDGSRSRLINFGRSIPHGELCSTNDRIVLLESASSLIWQFINIINPEQWILEERYDLYEMGIVLPFVKVASSKDNLLMVGHNGTCYERIIFQFNSTEEIAENPDLEIVDMSGVIQDMSVVNGLNRVTASISMELANQGTTEIDFFTVAWKLNGTICSPWYFQLVDVHNFAPNEVLEVNFNLEWESNHIGEIPDLIPLPEIWVIAVNGKPDSDRSNNFFMGYAVHRIVSEKEVIVTKDSIKVYPNPCQDWIRIESLSVASQVIHIYDMQGRLVTSLPGDKELIDLSDFQNGMYSWVATYLGNLSVSGKFLKQK